MHVMAALGLDSCKRIGLLAAAALLLLAARTLAQEEMPRFSGSGSVTQAINGDLGAVLDIGSGLTMTFPKGIPVGRSRLVTFKKSAKKPSGAQVQKGFTPIGTPLEFNMPISAGSAPIVLSMATKTDPRKKGDRLVLAMEVGTLCNAENKVSKGKNGLCSGWELVDADFESGAGAVTAKLQSTGGMRMVFGVVSEK
jgi:hypothetical protein